MLFIIVIVFIVFSIPRTILNLNELEHMLSWYYAQYVDNNYPAKEAECFNPPTWAVILCYFSRDPHNKTFFCNCWLCKSKQKFAIMF